MVSALVELLVSEIFLSFLTIQQFFLQHVIISIVSALVELLVSDIFPFFPHSPIVSSCNMS